MVICIAVKYTESPPTTQHLIISHKEIFSSFRVLFSAVLSFMDDDRVVELLWKRLYQGLPARHAAIVMRGLHFMSKPRFGTVIRMAVSVDGVACDPLSVSINTPPQAFP